MVNLLVSGLKSIGVRVITSLLTEKMLEWMFWKVAKLIVASTKTAHDDEFLEKLEEAYKK